MMRDVAEFYLGVPQEFPVDYAGENHLGVSVAGRRSCLFFQDLNFVPWKRCACRFSS